MKRLIALTILTVLALTFTMPVMAADKNEEYGTYGITCGAWVEARKELESGKENVFLNALGGDILQLWFAGYVTAFNSHVDDVYDILGSTDWVSVNLWMDKYCQENPLSNVSSGMEEITGELWANRQRTGD